MQSSQQLVRHLVLMFKRERKIVIKNAAAALGRLGGLKGGPARAKKLSPKKRRQIAKKAANARWREPS
ncbi:MAG: hypothetical protein AUH96_04185 [Nitrospirae bacterium 13_2_20CM_2_61_4]|nr:MAG: hypothetical protein AUH96_04185 [Nitrospirae bacterium 13_2_20CM_2_61_4]